MAGNPKVKIPFPFVPLPRAIWDDNIALSLGEFRLLGYLTRHQVSYGNEDVRLTDEELMFGRKKKGGERMDSGCGIKGRNNLKAAREALLARGWIAVEEDVSDRARPRRWYTVKITDKDNSTDAPPPVTPPGSDGNKSDTQLSETDSRVSETDSRVSESDSQVSEVDSQVSTSDTRTYRRGSNSRGSVEEDKNRGYDRPDRPERPDDLKHSEFNDSNQEVVPPVGVAPAGLSTAPTGPEPPQGGGQPLVGPKAIAGEARGAGPSRPGPGVPVACSAGPSPTEPASSRPGPQVPVTYSAPPPPTPPRRRQPAPAPAGTDAKVLQFLRDIFEPIIDRRFPATRYVRSADDWGEAARICYKLVMDNAETLVNLWLDSITVRERGLLQKELRLRVFEAWLEQHISNMKAAAAARAKNEIRQRQGQNFKNIAAALSARGISVPELAKIKKDDVEVTYSYCCEDYMNTGNLEPEEIATAYAAKFATGEPFYSYRLIEIVAYLRDLRHKAKKQQPG